MISPDCNKREFIEAVQDKDYPEIILMAAQEATEVRGLSLGPRPKAKERPMELQAWKHREFVIQGYEDFLKGFLFFMRFVSIKPGSVSDNDFQLFRPVCQNLVNKGQFKPEVMNFFDD